MKTKLMLTAMLLSIALLSFKTIPKDDYKVITITTTENSQQLEVTKFMLKDGEVLLNASSDFKFYVKIKSKNIKGKKLLKNLSKQKRNGKQYSVTYTYEYFPSGEKRTYNHNYITWEDGEVYDWKPTYKISIGGLIFKTKHN